MPDWLQAILAGVVGLALIGGVFWFAFARPPGRRADGGLKQHNAESYWGGGDGGGHPT